MFVLDTCVLSEGMRPNPDARVDRWFKAQESDDLYTTALTAGELRYGIDRLPASRRRERLEHWFAEAILVGFAGRVLAFDLAAASHWSAIRTAFANAGTVDSQIAAIALAHGFIVVTRNVRDFAFAGLAVFNPWTG